MAAVSEQFFPWAQQRQNLIDKRHKDNIFASINTYRRRKAFTDVVVYTNNAEFHAHRLILASSSPVLETMLSSDMKEKAEGRINLTYSNISPEVLEQILVYMYSGKINIMIDNVEELLYASSFLMMQSLRQFCEDFLVETLSIGNCIGIREIASKHECQRLFIAADGLLRKEFIAASSTEEFSMMSARQLVEILAIDDIEIREEDDVLTSIINWIDRCPNKRRQHLGDFLLEVRLQFVTDERLSFIEDFCQRNVGIKEYSDIAILISEAWYAKNEWMHSGEQIQVGKHITPRACLDRKQVVFSCGGYDGARCMQSCFAVIPCEGKVFSLKCMKVARQDHSVAELTGCLYVVGGFNSHRGPLDSVECYNHIRNEWTIIHPMNAKRKALAVSVLNGKLYATGGLDGNYKSLNTTEFYDPISGTWQLSYDLVEPRYSHCLVSDEHNLYAIGGWKMASVERFDPVKSTWELISEMSCPRAGATAELVNDRIYVTGGRGDNGCLSSVEAYDINMDQWMTMPEASIPRWRASSCLLDDCIYIFGGRDSNWQYLNCIESFDIKEKCWRREKELVSNLMGLSCCATKIPRKHLK